MHDIVTCHSVAELRELRHANPVAALVRIMPKLAGQLLQIERKNREIKQGVVEKYQEEMLAGSWLVYNAETIKLASNFAVIDGQHRLTAAVAAGVSLVALVAFDVPGAAIHTVDVGRLRSAGDMLGIEGCKYGRRVAAVIYKSWMYDRGMSVWERPSKAQIFEFWQRYPDIAASTVMVRGFRKWNETLAGWLSWVTAGDAVEFITQVDKGIGLEERDPRYQLREHFSAARERSSKATRVDVRFVWAVTIKAYRLFAEGKQNANLRWPVTESFPRLPEVLAPNAGKTLEISAPAKAA